MKLRNCALALGLLGGALTTTAAEAATVFKGVAVVTSRTTTIPACSREYSVGETFTVIYRPNFGAFQPETLSVLGPDGGFLIVSTDLTDLTLRTGSVKVEGFAYSVPFEISTSSQPISITPSSITTSTKSVFMSGTVKNIGFANCNVGFNASLVKVPAPF